MTALIRICSKKMKTRMARRKTRIMTRATKRKERRPEKRMKRPAKRRMRAWPMNLLELLMNRLGMDSTWKTAPEETMKAVDGLDENR